MKTKINKEIFLHVVKTLKMSTTSAPISASRSRPSQSVKSPYPIRRSISSDKNNPYCRQCVQKLLSSKILAHKEALEERNRKRTWCATQLTQMRTTRTGDTETDGDEPGSLIHPSILPPPQMVDQYQDRIAQLTQKLNTVMQECGSKSVALATMSVQTSARAAALEDQKIVIDQARRNLDALNDALITGISGYTDESDRCNNAEMEVGSLSSTIRMHVDAVKQTRFQLALKAFNMHIMDVGTEYQSLTLQDLSNPSSDAGSSTSASAAGQDATSSKPQVSARFQRLVDERVPSGIGKIFGLLLPHRGPSHFNGVLPTNILTSSLRLVASLVNILARCLSIELPHPIALKSSIGTGGMTNGSISNKGGTVGYSRSRSNALKRITNQQRNEIEEDSWVEQAADIVQSVMYEDEMKESEPKSSSNDDHHTLTLMKHLHELDIGNEDKEEGGDDVILTAERNNGKNNDGSKSNHSTVANNDHGKVIEDTNLASSTSSVLSLMSSNLLKSTALKAFGKMTGHKVSTNYDGATGSAAYNALGDGSVRTTPSMDDVSISERLKHANYAVIFESTIRTRPVNSVSNVQTHDKTRNGRYILKPPSSSARSDHEMKQKEEEQFTIGLQLLQNDIIALCIKAGVPVNALWPAEAMLLNLNSLKLYCQSQIKSN